MNRRFFTMISLAAAILSATICFAGSIVDRIIATVNGHIILLSDWEDALRYQAFVSGRSVDQLTVDERKGVLDHMIDQELLGEQMHAADFRHATEAEITQKAAEVRKQYPTADSGAGWQAVLAKYGFTEADLNERIGRELDLMQLVDARLRPSVNVDPKSIESYYNQEFLPQLRQKGAADVPLAEVSPKIKELLTQQKVNQLLVAWLQNLRAGSEIRTGMPPDFRGELR